MRISCAYPVQTGMESIPTISILYPTHTTPKLCRSVPLFANLMLPFASQLSRTACSGHNGRH